jgi:hypothetical protein
MRTESRPTGHKPQGGHSQGKQPNEGEGNRTAAKEYDRKAEEFARSGKVGPSAEKAKRAVEGDEREELENAERTGRRPARS